MLELARKILVDEQQRRHEQLMTVGQMTWRLCANDGRKGEVTGLEEGCVPVEQGLISEGTDLSFSDTEVAISIEVHLA